MEEVNPVPVTETDFEAAPVETDLIIDLAVLLRAGFVAVVTEGPDEDLIPRFNLTPRGRHECHHDDVTGPVNP